MIFMNASNIVHVHKSCGTPQRPKVNKPNSVISNENRKLFSIKIDSSRRHVEIDRKIFWSELV